MIPIIPVTATVTDSGDFHGVDWEYGETTDTANTTIIFENEAMTFEDNGIYVDTYNYTSTYYDGSYLYETETMCQTESIYQYNSSQLISGNITLMLEYTADYVRITAGKSLDYS